MRLIAPALLAASMAACGGDRPADFSGRWLVGETDPDCKHEYSRCWLEIDQRGDRVTLRAWGEGDDWTCDGRGTVTGNRLRFQWAGQDKKWRGSAEIELTGDEFRGTHQRVAERAALQYCRGARHP